MTEKPIFSVGDLVWFWQPDRSVSIERIRSVQYSTQLHPEDAPPHVYGYKIDSYYGLLDTPNQRFVSPSDLFPYPEGRAQLRERMYQRARWISTDADELEDDSDDTYWMSSELKKELGLAVKDLMVEGEHDV